MTPMPMYRFVHACCEPDNLLSRWTAYSRAVEMVEITKEHDLNYPLGMARAVDALRGCNDVLRCSPPCAGESAWQRLNMRKGGVTAERIQKEHDEFACVWSSFSVLMA